MEGKDFYLNIDGKAVKVSEEVYREFYRGERRERYFMKDLKSGTVTVDPKTGVVTICPPREVSYERLGEAHFQFISEDELMEDTVVRSEILKGALGSLPKEEQDLIHELYFLEKTEREVAVSLHMAQSTLRRKRDAAFGKLRELLDRKKQP